MVRLPNKRCSQYAERTVLVKISVQGDWGGAAAAGHTQHASNDHVRRAGDRRTVTLAVVWRAHRRPGPPLPACRRRVVEEALAVIAHGSNALTMRRCCPRKSPSPAPSTTTSRSKQQLQDLVLDGVLAVDLDLDPLWAGPSGSSSWPTGFAECSRPIRSGWHPQDPRPAGTQLLAGRGLPWAAADGRVVDREAGLAFFLLLDYTIGAAVSSPASVNELRVRGQPPKPAAPVLPLLLTASRPGRPGRHLGRQPRQRVQRRPAGPGRWAGTQGTPPPTGAQETANHHPAKTSTLTADNQWRHTKEGTR